MQTRFSLIFVAATASMLLCGVSGCIGFDDMMYGSIQEGSFNDNTLDRINQYREKHELHELAWSATLQELAQEHADDMDRRGELDHNGFDSRMARSGSSYCVENCAAGGTTSAAVLDMWRHSSGHNKNLLNGTVQYGAVAHSGPYAVYFACY